MAESFPLGTLVRIQAEFYNEDGDLDDPAEVKLTIITPANVETTYTYGSLGLITVQRESPGIYFAELTGSLENKYQFRFWSPPDDPVQAASEGFFRIRSSAFAG